MANQILVPSLGESITEATVSKWLKQIGEKDETDEALVELETDKVNVEVPSPLEGILSSIKTEAGSVVKVGAILGIVEEKKSTTANTLKTESTVQKSFVPPKTAKSKKINKNKKSVFEKQKKPTFVEQSKERDSNEALILDTLAHESVEEVTEKKYGY